MKKILLLIAFFLGGCGTQHAQKITQGDQSWYSCDVRAGVYGRVEFVEMDTRKKIVLYGTMVIEQTDIPCRNQ